LALQFPDFDPVAATIPAIPVAWAGAQAVLIVSIAAAAIAGWALFRRGHRQKQTPPGAPEATESVGSRIFWNGVWGVAAVAVAVFALHFVVLLFRLDRIGPLPIRWYALAYIAGILLGWRYCILLVKSPKLWGAKAPTMTPIQVDDLVLWVTLAIILGGRIGYILFYMLVSPDQRAGLASNPAEVFEIWHGGMSFHGAATAVGVAVIAFALANRLSILGVLDLVAASEPIGQCFGRIANFVNGELWGRVTNVPWGMNFCNARLVEGSGHCPADVQAAGGWEHVARHPSQLYEATLEGVVLFLVLMFATHRLKWLQRPGAVTGLWLIGYGAIRIGLENVRNPDLGMPNFPLGLTMGMILSIPMILIGAALIWRALRAPPPASAAPTAAKPA
jgi:phosphatidylglycerol:prolipoprotein diacylglycerol transferase